LSTYNEQAMILYTIHTPSPVASIDQ